VPIFRPIVPLLAIWLALGACADRPSHGGAPLSNLAIGPGWVHTASGERLALHSRMPASGEPRAVILALHGFGDSGEQTFGPASTYWAERGIATYAPDQRGFGRNDSFRRWPGAQVLVADAVAVSRAVRATHPRVPLVVVGESMGGGVALAAVAQGLEADALVLSGPAIAGGDALNPLLRAGGWTLSTFLPDQRWTGDRIVKITPTDNRTALVMASRNPRSYGTASSRELYGLVRLMDLAAAAAPKVYTPTLTLVGSKDEITSPAGIRKVHERIPGRAGLIEYPEGWHWLFRDLQARRVWSDVANFVLAPTL
jgi:acylglycerol lipase